MKIWLACLLFLVPCAAAHGDLVIFELGSMANGSAIDGVASGALTMGGLTATFTANDGFLNATTTYFGINAAGSGDDTDQIDSGSGVNEFITITFDAPVALTQVSLANFTAGEQASLTVGLNAPLLLDGANANIQDFTSDSFLLGNTLSVGQALVIGYSGPAANNGFSLEGLHVNTVPEATALTFGWLMAGLSQLRRRRRTALP